MLSPPLNNSKYIRNKFENRKKSNQNVSHNLSTGSCFFLVNNYEMKVLTSNPLHGVTSARAKIGTR